MTDDILHMSESELAAIKVLPGGVNNTKPNRESAAAPPVNWKLERRLKEQNESEEDDPEVEAERAQRRTMHRLDVGDPVTGDDLGAIAASIYGEVPRCRRCANVLVDGSCSSCPVGVQARVIESKRRRPPDVGDDA